MVASRAVASTNGFLCPFQTVALAWAVFTCLHFFVLQVASPAPYMDEPFHVGQTQTYCAGRFHVWDPKITTLPGLYAFGLALTQPVRFALVHFFNSNFDPCQSTSFLRCVNVIFGYLVLQELFFLFRKRCSSASKAAALALVGSLLPVHFFYTGLYYTDAGSLFFVLLSFRLNEQGRLMPCFFAATASVLFRQTNIVWVALLIGQQILAVLDPATRPAFLKNKEKNSKPPLQLSDGLLLLQRLKVQFAAAAVAPGPLYLLPALFTAFLHVNGGIVVGDRSAHEAALHFMQVPYFAAYVVLLLAPMLVLGRVERWARGLSARRLVLWTSLIALCAARFTLVHPYLTADNRHYTFYLWRRLLGKPLVQRALVPVYALCLETIWTELSRRRGQFWAAGFFISTSLALVPAKLLEFRYFTAPFLLLFITLAEAPAGQEEGIRGGAWATALGYLAVNAGTSAIFALRPFQAPDGSVGRFIW